MAGRFLHVTQRHPGVKRGCDEGLAKGVRPDTLGDPGATSDAAHDPTGGVAVRRYAVKRAHEPLCSRELLRHSRHLEDVLGIGEPRVSGRPNRASRRDGRSRQDRHFDRAVDHPGRRVPYDIGQHAPMSSPHRWRRSDTDPANVRDIPRVR